MQIYLGRANLDGSMSVIKIDTPKWYMVDTTVTELKSFHWKEISEAEYSQFMPKANVPPVDLNRARWEQEKYSRRLNQRQRGR